MCHSCHVPLSFEPERPWFALQLEFVLERHEFAALFPEYVLENPRENLASVALPNIAEEENQLFQ